MILEFCSIQSKKVAALRDWSDELIKACRQPEMENRNQSAAQDS